MALRPPRQLEVGVGSASSSASASASVNRLILPLVTLLLLLVAVALVGIWHPPFFLAIAIPLTVALALIRLLVYGMRESSARPLAARRPSA